jgi:hypothetical protein
VRIATSGAKNGVRAMAFAAGDGGYVVELLNSLREASRITLAFDGKLVSIDLAPRSITTLTW